MQERISSGIEILDQLLEGGYEKDSITTIYGPAGSGKTNTAIMAAISVINKGKKVIFIDTEGGFSIRRLEQISKDSKKILSNMVFFHPTTFEEQKKAVEKLTKISLNNIGIIIIDTIGMIYRLERKTTERDLNTELSEQISCLTQISRKQNIPILLTNQVYTNFETRKNQMIGGEILNYASKCLIEYDNMQNNKKRAILRKHRSIVGEKEIIFEIYDKGLRKPSLVSKFL